MSSKEGWLATRRIASPPPKPLIPTMPTRMLMVVSCCWSERIGLANSRCRRRLGSHGVAHRDLQVESGQSAVLSHRRADAPCRWVAAIPHRRTDAVALGDQAGSLTIPPL